MSAPTFEEVGLLAITMYIAAIAALLVAGIVRRRAVVASPLVGRGVPCVIVAVLSVLASISQHSPVPFLVAGLFPLGIFVFALSQSRRGIDVLGRRLSKLVDCLEKALVPDGFVGSSVVEVWGTNPRFVKGDVTVVVRGWGEGRDAPKSPVGNSGEYAFVTVLGGSSVEAEAIKSTIRSVLGDRRLDSVRPLVYLLVLTGLLLVVFAVSIVRA